MVARISLYCIEHAVIQGKWRFCQHHWMEQRWWICCSYLLVYGVWYVWVYVCFLEESVIEPRSIHVHAKRKPCFVFVLYWWTICLSCHHLILEGIWYSPTTTKSLWPRKDTFKAGGAGSPQNLLSSAPLDKEVKKKEINQYGTLCNPASHRACRLGQVDILSYNARGE